MAARDHLPDFWEDVKEKCASQGIEVGSPIQDSAISGDINATGLKEKDD